MSEKKEKQKMLFVEAKLNKRNVIYSNDFFLKNEAEKNSITITLEPKYTLILDISKKEFDDSGKISIKVNDDEDTPSNEQKLLIQHDGTNGIYSETKPRRLFIRRAREDGKVVFEEEISMTFIIEIKSELVIFSLILLSKEI